MAMQQGGLHEICIEGNPRSTTTHEICKTMFQVIILTQTIVLKQVLFVPKPNQTLITATRVSQI